ncbi:hypothetical protein RJ639_014948 [Escallonia herrerae]|uniref:DNA-directed primase/polymerase protein n=1 Tax=Escallonia herrerae TaxID=1293975 RepID=A0AA88VGI6_9ASTE|nr:hypothetical protein RJ639_014948 [Escallonia herrerae]
MLFAVGLLESAVRERRIKRSKLKQVSSVKEASTSPDMPSAGSSGKTQQHSTDSPSRMQNVYTASTSNCLEPMKFSFIFGTPAVKSGSRFSPLVFYGSPHGVPPKRPAHWLRLLHEIRVDLSEQNKLREGVWSTFPRQEDAMKYAKDQVDVHIFSYQDHVNGQRRFLVSTYKEFWQRYKNMNPRFRHHYEVIQEGAPCHLYFDLEFNKQENAEKNGDEMVDLLLVVVFDALLEKYSIQGNHDWIVELDSSTKGMVSDGWFLFFFYYLRPLFEKFSRHLVIRLHKTAFRDNTHAGAFVAEICSRVHSSRGRDKRFEKLFISKGDSSSADIACQLFVDMAVYSRNRCFRLPLSSKAGKSSLLLPTARFKCKDMSEEDMFMASLICHMDVDCEKLLICKMDLDCVKALHFDTETNSEFLRESTFPHNFVSDAFTSDASRTYLIGKSPFPALDVFVESIASLGNVSGGYLDEKYEVGTGSRSMGSWCTVCRETDSVNESVDSTRVIMFPFDSVIYVVDLRQAAYYQKCHDPDCRGYRSPLRPIPSEAIPDSTILLNLVGRNDIREHITHYTPDSCKTEKWLLEAIRVTDKVENMQRTLDLTDRDQTSDEDDDWWMAVERAASQTELMYSGQT